jgi:hypothetical protein
MDKPAEFYYNYQKETPAMTTTDFYERKIEKLRGYEIGQRNAEMTPHLAETFFGDASRIHGSSFSIEKERSNNRRNAFARAMELSKRRKLTSAAEKYKFF